MSKPARYGELRRFVGSLQKNAAVLRSQLTFGEREEEREEAPRGKTRRRIVFNCWKGRNRFQRLSEMKLCRTSDN